MPEFYMILSEKYFLPEFWGSVPTYLPTPVSCTYGEN